MMRFVRVIDQVESFPERAVQQNGIVARCRQTATLLRSIRRKRGDDDIPTRFESVHYLIEVPFFLERIDQKMKHGVAMLGIVTMALQRDHGDVADQPLHPSHSSPRSHIPDSRPVAITPPCHRIAHGHLFATRIP
ncbi:MAG: hypothetical protein ABI835_13340 [Chloroflexota bacterium]